MRSTGAWGLDDALLMIAIALFPFYVFPSGGVQPTHMTFMLLTAVALYRYGMPNKSWAWLILFMAIYSFFIELIYGVLSIYGDPRHLVTPAFFLFNFFLSISVYQVVLRKGASSLAIGIIIASVVAVISVYISGVDLQELSDSGRSTGTFNNPNQLGYFSVCLLSLAYLLYWHKAIRFLTMMGLFAASFFLAIASLSKAAMIANVLVVVFALRPQAKGYSAILWFGLAVVALGGGAYLLLSGSLDDYLFYRRIVNMGQEQDSSLADRGYFAFLDGSVIQIVIGMGSSEVFWIVGHEVHSTFASVVNSYGIIGFVAFASIFVIWERTLYKTYGIFGSIVITGPALLYGITHNGTRFSIFWLLLSASMGLAVRQTRLFQSRSDSLFMRPPGSVGRRQPI